MVGTAERGELLIFYFLSISRDHKLGWHKKHVTFTALGEENESRGVVLRPFFQPTPPWVGQKSMSKTYFWSNVMTWVDSIRSHNLGIHSSGRRLFGAAHKKGGIEGVWSAECRGLVSSE